MIPPSLPKIFISFLLAVVFSGAQCSHYIGCFREALENEKLLPLAKKTFKNDLTPENCVQHCKSHGYGYAGVEVGTDCYCSEERPHFSLLAEQEVECNSPCKGDTTKMCGGERRVGVYTLDDHGENYVKDNYKGCYKNFYTEKDWKSSLEVKFENILTPELCVGYCFRHGFDYAGAHDGNKCRCGHTLEGTKVSDALCKKECSGYNKLTCGDKSKSSVYRTNANDVLRNLDANYEGCFKAPSDDRVFKTSMLFLRELTPRRCAEYCFDSSYTVAALQSGTQCYCADTFDEDHVPSSQCDLACSGETRNICGGRNANSVYKLNSVEKGKYVGCYSDQKKARTFPLSTYVKLTNNTPQVCIDHCIAEGYSYAAVKFGNECFCGNERPLHRLVTNDRKCTANDCSGDPTQKCGGPWRHLVYTTGM